MSSTPVVLLSVDTLRADRFTEACFPESMPILENDFAQFINAYSHGNETERYAQRQREPERRSLDTGADTIADFRSNEAKCEAGRPRRETDRRTRSL